MMKDGKSETAGGAGTADMTKVLSIAAISALALAGSATLAHAQAAPAKPKPNFTVQGDFNARDAQFGPQEGRRLVWDAKKGRWGLTLDITPRADLGPTARDVEAGAFFKVTPRLRVGGAVGVGPNQPAPIRKTDGREETPRVRLETAFKF
jgi:hypothetical protein